MNSSNAIDDEYAYLRNDTDNRSASVIQIETGRLLPWIAFSWLLSGGAVIGVILMALMMPHIIDAKVSSGVSDAKASIATQTAEANATAQTARTHARVALDKVEDVRAKLAEKGINITLDGH